MRVVDINRISGREEIPDVDEAWTVHPSSRRDDPGAFYDHVDRRDSRPTLVAAPSTIEHLERLLDERLRAGAPRLVRICPGRDRHGYPLEAWAVSPIPELCERNGLSIAVDAFASGPADYPWSAIVGFARTYPGLPVVGLAAPLASPAAGKALDVTPNLILETSEGTQRSLDSVARLAAEHGPHRLAYGSGEQATSPTAISTRVESDQAEWILNKVAMLLDTSQWSQAFL